MRNPLATCVEGPLRSSYASNEPTRRLIKQPKYPVLRWRLNRQNSEHDSAIHWLLAQEKRNGRSLTATYESSVTQKHAGLIGNQGDAIQL